tara:strand:- start:243 stop:569 length:327 start_codon:yes stop_codon:yes gene_type:complete
MKVNKIAKFSLGVLFGIPLSVFFGGEIFANHLSDSVKYEIHNETHLLACGGGGGGGGGSKPGALKTKKLNSKLNFKKRQLSKAAAAGEDTSSLQAEIKKLEAAISEME